VFHMSIVRVLQCLAIVGATLFTGCMVVPKPTAQELQALDSPPADIKVKIDRLFPRVLAWYEAVEAELLPQGRSLTAQETEVARKLGVQDPTRVRVAVLEAFPMPSDPELSIEAKRFGLGSRSEGGRTNGYVIMLKPRVAQNKTVLAHELVHVAQHDRLGRAAFLRRYLVEMELLGYARSPLELEAYAKQGLVQ
jgi:hypothetical protein